MPLLMCPNDNAAMQTVNRSEVQFDICPTCRGVWLDRGELEKLMGAAQDTGSGAEYRESRPPERRYEDQRRHEDHRRYEGERRWHDDDYRKKKRRGFDIFDIFD